MKSKHFYQIVITHWKFKGIRESFYVTADSVTSAVSKAEKIYREGHATQKDEIRGAYVESVQYMGWISCA